MCRKGIKLHTYGESERLKPLKHKANCEVKQIGNKHIDFDHINRKLQSKREQNERSQLKSQEMNVPQFAKQMFLDMVNDSKMEEKHWKKVVGS